MGSDSVRKKPNGYTRKRINAGISKKDIDKSVNKLPRTNALDG